MGTKTGIGQPKHAPSGVDVAESLCEADLAECSCFCFSEAFAATATCVAAKEILNDAFFQDLLPCYGVSILFSPSLFCQGVLGAQAAAPPSCRAGAELAPKLSLPRGASSSSLSRSSVWPPKARTGFHELVSKTDASKNHGCSALSHIKSEIRPSNLHNPQDAPQKT